MSRYNRFYSVGKQLLPNAPYPCACDDDPENTTGTYQPCRTCNGTGRGARGGRGGCKTCHGMRREWRNDIRTKCKSCNGTGIKHSTNLCDTLDTEAALSIPIRIVRSTREQSWTEQHLGIGRIYSCVDYGRSLSRTDDELVAEVREHIARGYNQATHFADKSGHLVDVIGVITARTGYTVVGVNSPSF